MQKKKKVFISVYIYGDIDTEKIKNPCWLANNLQSDTVTNDKSRNSHDFHWTQVPTSA